MIEARTCELRRDSKGESDKITSKFTPPVGTSSPDCSWIREQVYVFRMDG